MEVQNNNKVEAVEEVNKFKVPKELRDSYNKTFYIKHKGEKVVCPQCKYAYSIFNKSHHIKSKLHLQVLQFLNDNN